MVYFNELHVDLNDHANFPLSIYGQTKENPNKKITALCNVCKDSLDAYASQFCKKLLSGLGL